MREAVPEPQPAARILVVDDSALNRRKLSLAVKTLGHEPEMAEDGVQALAALRARAFDAVLLDIVMPGMDGFEVLHALKSDAALRDIPVIVVSALDDETASVVRAISLGAEDFLPKDFDPVLLQARLGASLAKKRFRDTELAYFRGVERLTRAAEVLEAGEFRGASLDLDELAARNDPLGRLAAVFRGMAAEIYDRELRLKRTVQLLQGSFLVIAVGLVWGLTPALSRLSAGIGSNPLGLAVWVNFIAAVCCLGVAAWRGRLPRLTGVEFLFFLAWAALAGILQRLTTFWVTAHVEAAMLSLIVTLQGFMVFAFVAVTKLERTSPRRLVGLSVGLVGVAIVLWTRFDPGNSEQNGYLIFALALPFLFAVEAIVLAGRRPKHVDMFASVGLMMGLSAVMLLPVAYATGDLMPLRPEVGKLELLVLLIGIVGAGSLLLAFHVIATAGAVFYSQSAYTMTLAGIVWGMLLLNEELSAVAWAAFAVILVGMYLVEPKASDDKLVISRSFTAAPPQRRSA